MPEPDVSEHKHARGLKLLRVACLVTLAAIAVEFAVGMVVNMYVDVPSSDAHASWLKEIETAPAMLTAHAVLGLILLVGALIVLVQSIRVRNWPLITASVVGLLVLAGAFAAGEAFVKTDNDSLSLTMAFLAAAGVLCYALVQSIAHSVSRRAIQQA